MRLILLVSATLALAYLGVVALLFAVQRRLVFPATTLRVSAQEAGLSGFTDVEIVTEDGERLVGWWRPPERGRALLLYFHGNGGSLLNRRNRAELLTRNGRGLLLVSYRGYSGSTGSPSEAGLRRDAEAAYSYLSSYEPARIVAYGESLGSGVAVWLAAHRTFGGLILDAPFTSIADVARPSFGFVPLDLLLLDHFRSIDLIGRINTPLLVLHGTRDSVVPVELGRRLFAAAPEPKRFVALSGVDHISVLENGGLPVVEAFLDGVEQRWRPDPMP